MLQIIYSETELRDVAKKLVEATKSKILCFHGEMGSGKTTLIKALVKELGGGNFASSPTFGIVNEYHFQDGTLLAFHFDFYRLDDEMEALDLGFEEYLDQNVWVFIEWPDKIGTLLPHGASHITLTLIDDKTRKLTLK